MNLQKELCLIFLKIVNFLIEGKNIKKTELNWMSIEKVTIVCNHPLNDDLKDRRGATFGSSLGSLDTLSKQYGIEVEERNNFRFFSAPKRRMQIFIQHLHFGNVAYTII